MLERAAKVAAILEDADAQRRIRAQIDMLGGAGSEPE